MKDLEGGRAQVGKLASSVYAYASYIDRLDELSQAIEKIVHAHVNTKILPETYPVIGECIIAALQDVLGEAATPEIVAAWTEAYQALAHILINREHELFQQKNRALFSPKTAAQ